ncbi:MAG: sel1 repeat family protein [Kiritimatiellales bacterium]|nr:sel1 repeat family protein [Kiritimatiellales bacterium]MCF7863356.1 sel1 repeat family protein [Kiritimatiellales bacterium]
MKYKWLITVLAWVLNVSVVISALEDLSQRARAEQGDAAAQLALGLAYTQGEVVNLDYKEGIRWLTLSAAQNNAVAEYYLGKCFHKGLGVPKNHEKAREFYQRSAEQGCALGQNGLGVLYSTGEGAPQDAERAFEWYKKAAEQGLPEAQCNLADYYYTGTGVKKDELKAFKEYSNAALQGNALAQFKMGCIYYNGYVVSQDYSSAKDCWKLAAKQGNPDAQRSLAFCYSCGLGGDVDYEKSVEWFRCAAEQGDAESQYNLALFYYAGKVVQIDYKEAAKWCSLAAEQGNVSAQKKIAKVYATGQGVPVDYEKALNWYKKAAEQGDKDAMKTPSFEPFLNPEECIKIPQLLGLFPSRGLPDGWSSGYGLSWGNYTGCVTYNGRLQRVGDVDNEILCDIESDSEDFVQWITVTAHCFNEDGEQETREKFVRVIKGLAKELGIADSFLESIGSTFGYEKRIIEESKYKLTMYREKASFGYSLIFVINGRRAFNQTQESQPHMRQDLQSGIAKVEEKKLPKSDGDPLVVGNEWLHAGGRIWTGVELYYGMGNEKSYVGEVLGGNNRYVDFLTGRKYRGIKLRMKSGTVEWKDRSAVATGHWFIRKNDPAFRKMEWVVYEY